MAKHGTSGRYKSGCRCDECRTYKRESSRRDRERTRKLPPEGWVSLREAYARFATGRRHFDSLRATGHISEVLISGRVFIDPASVTVAEAALAQRRKAERRLCTEDGCDEPVHGHDRCKSHYGKYRRKVLGVTDSSAEYQAERKMARGRHVRPPGNSPYRVLARSCPRCGELLTTPPEALRRDSSLPLPTCKPCGVRRTVKYQKERRATDPEYDAKWRARMASMRDRYLAATQAETSAGASRNGYIWTSAELELVVRQDLTTKEVAKVLGRSYAATAMAKHRCAHDPKFIELLGAGRRQHGEATRPR